MTTRTFLDIPPVAAFIAELPPDPERDRLLTAYREAANAYDRELSDRTERPKQLVALVRQMPGASPEERSDLLVRLQELSATALIADELVDAAARTYARALEASAAHIYDEAYARALTETGKANELDHRAAPLARRLNQTHHDDPTFASLKAQLDPLLVEQAGHSEAARRFESVASYAEHWPRGVFRCGDQSTQGRTSRDAVDRWVHAVRQAA